MINCTDFRTQVLDQFQEFGIFSHGEGLPNPIGMWREEQERLLTYLYSTNPDDNWLEIGTYCGGTTVLLCLAKQILGGKGKVITCDSNVNQFFFHNMQRGRFDNLWIIVNDKSDNLTEYLDNKSFINSNGISFALIDGFHSFSQVVTDFFVILPYLTNKSVVCFHDCGPQLSIDRFRTEIPIELKNNPALLSDLLEDDTENFFINESISWILEQYKDFKFYNIEVGKDCFHPHETGLSTYICGRTSPMNSLYAIVRRN